MPVAIIPLVAEVAIAIAIPAVVVLDPSVVAFPIAFKKRSTFVPWCYPARTGIRTPRPIAFMPLVAVAFWIPIAVYPEIIRTWYGRANPLHTGCGGWSNANSKGHLSGE
jgi:hypothetical protein